MNILKARVAAIALSAAFASASCATLFQGNKEEIMVASDPAGAQVTTNDGRSGTTPYSMRVGRDDDVQIHINKAGYNSTDISDTSHMEWGYFVADFLFTGLIGLAVDGIDGAMFYHNQTMVTAHLEPLTPPATGISPSAAAAMASDQPRTAPKPSAAPPASPQVGDQWNQSDHPQ